MDHRIARKEAFQVVGRSIRVPMEHEENSRLIPKFWEECMRDGTWDQLQEVSAKDRSYGVCADFDPSGRQFTYMIAVRSEQARPGLETRVIPASSWAIFESHGALPKAIQESWERIFADWPSTGCKRANAPQLEVYLPGDTDSDDYRCEIWIPIQET